MTYLTLCRRLQEAGIENAEWEAKLLLEHFCGVPLASHPDVELDYESPALEEALGKREARYPLQYLLGEWWFYRQSYLISPDCLIPRSDTEVLVERAIAELPRGARFADFCTGSGCIAISVLCERPDTTAVAVDKFEATLSLAIQNAERNGVTDRFSSVCTDLLTEEPSIASGSLDAILCNPPYIDRATLAGLAPELAHEPQAALDGGEDGLVFYRRILQAFPKYLREDGFFLFEIGFDQAEAVKEIGAAAGFGDCSVLRDLGGNTRALLLRRTV